jgi:hypothetical protein
MTDRPPVLWIDLNRADRRRRRMSRASSEVVDDTNGDLNDDGTVDGGDLARALGGWGVCP